MAVVGVFTKDSAYPFTQRTGRSSDKIWNHFTRFKRHFYEDENLETQTKVNTMSKCVFCGSERSGNLSTMCNHILYQCDYASDAAKQDATAYKERFRNNGKKKIK